MPRNREEDRQDAPGAIGGTELAARGWWLVPSLHCVFADKDRRRLVEHKWVRLDRRGSFCDPVHNERLSIIVHGETPLRPSDHLNYSVVEVFSGASCHDLAHVLVAEHKVQGL